MPGFKVGLNFPQLSQDCAGELTAYLGSATDPVPSNKVEVGRVHRWVFSALRPLQADSLSLLTGQSENFLIYASKCTRPTVEIDEIKIHAGQNEIYRPGKHRWSPIDLTFYDIYTGGDSQNELAVMNAGVSEKIYKWWSEVVVNTQNNTIPRDFYVNAKLHMLDGLGRKIWEYNLYDCWPIKVSPNDLDYSNTALSEISITLRYNKAEEVKARTN